MFIYTTSRPPPSQTPGRRLASCRVLSCGPEPDSPSTRRRPIAASCTRTRASREGAARRVGRIRRGLLLLDLVQKRALEGMELW